MNSECARRSYSRTDGDERRREDENTSDPFLKDRTAERTLTAMQRMAAREVMTLKHRQVIKKGSALARTRPAGAGGSGGRELCASSMFS